MLQKSQEILLQSLSLGGLHSLPAWRDQFSIFWLLLSCRFKSQKPLELWMQKTEMLWPALTYKPSPPRNPPPLP